MMHSVSPLWSLGVDNMNSSLTRLTQLKRKWDQLWLDIEHRILRLPKSEQNILLEDFQTAIESRIIVMERINNAKKGN